MTAWGKADGVGKKGRSTWNEKPWDYCSCGNKKDMHDYVCGECEARLGAQDRRPAGRGERSCGINYRYAYRIVSSPEFCWRRGGLLFEHELIPTLEMGHMTPGTVFERGGKRLVVVGAEGEPQRLEEG